MILSLDFSMSLLAAICIPFMAVSVVDRCDIACILSDTSSGSKRLSGGENVN